jgi:SpoIIAA-like
MLAGGISPPALTSSGSLIASSNSCEARRQLALIGTRAPIWAKSDSILLRCTGCIPCILRHMETQVITTRAANVWLGTDGIMRIISLPGTGQTLDDAQELVAAVKHLSAGTSRPLMVDMREMKSQSRDARHYYTGSEAAGTIRAAALVIGSPLSRVIANFAMGFNQIHVPTKLFTSEEDALAWLQGFVK